MSHNPDPIAAWEEARLKVNSAWDHWWYGEMLDAQPNAERINEIVIALHRVAQAQYQLERSELLDAVRDMAAED